MLSKTVIPINKHFQRGNVEVIYVRPYEYVSHSSYKIYAILMKLMIAFTTYEKKVYFRN